MCRKVSRYRAIFVSILCEFWQVCNFRAGVPVGSGTQALIFILILNKYIRIMYKVDSQTAVDTHGKNFFRSTCAQTHIPPTPFYLCVRSHRRIFVPLVHNNITPVLTSTCAHYFYEFAQITPKRDKSALFQAPQSPVSCNYSAHLPFRGISHSHLLTPPPYALTLRHPPPNTGDYYDAGPKAP